MENAPPTVFFASLSDGEVLNDPLTTGSIEIDAWDRDVGSRNGAGIASVEVIVTDLSTGAVVSEQAEQAPGYEFGTPLAEGQYRLEVIATSQDFAGGTSSSQSITVTVVADAVEGAAPTATEPATTATTPTPTPAAPTAPIATPAAPTATPAAPTPAAPVPPVASAPPAPQLDAGVSETIATSLAALNQVRANAGLAPLGLNATMSAYALDWSHTMAQSGFRHSYGPYGENLARYGDGSISGPAAALHFNMRWVESPGHYANMVDERYTEVGIAFYHDASGWWATHVFR